MTADDNHYIDLTKLKDIDSLIEKTASIIFDKKPPPNPDYFSSKKTTLQMIKKGFKILPELYHEPFVDPLRAIITKHYDRMVSIGQNQFQLDSPWTEWLGVISQRATGYLAEATHAFEESVADLCDGFLSMEESKFVKPPEYLTVPPLVVWGDPSMGPYTVPANTADPLKNRMRMSIVSLPPAYAGNIALWAALGHETAGHDILHADEGLANEITVMVERELLKYEKDRELDEKITYAGRKITLLEFATNYWKARIDETASDVCGLLNLGPAAAVGMAVLFIAAARGRLTTEGSISDPHPVDLLRLSLAAHLIRNFPDLDAKVSETWANAIEQIVLQKYVKDNGKWLTVKVPQHDLKGYADIKLPFSGMKKTVGIVANAIAYTPLDCLERHSLSEINTWDNADEALALRIARDLLDNSPPRLDPLYDEEEVYAAHIISGATIASASNAAGIDSITKNAISALNELYSTNPVWKGFPFRLRSDQFRHNFLPSHVKIEKQ